MKKLLLTALTLTCAFTFSGCSFTSVVANLYKKSFVDIELPVPKRSSIVEYADASSEYYEFVRVKTKEDNQKALIFTHIATGEQSSFILSETTYIPEYFLEFPGEVQFLLTHEGAVIIDWDVVDTRTLESVKALSSEEFFTQYNKRPQYFPEHNPTNPIMAPETIYLSQWDPKTTYTLSLWKDENGEYVVPMVVNDTDESVATVYFKGRNEEYDFLEEEYYINKKLDAKTIRISNKGDAIDFCWYPNPKDSDYCFLAYQELSRYQNGDRIPTHFNHYFFNDTTNVIRLTDEESGESLILQPNEMGEVSWVFDEVIISIDS